MNALVHIHGTTMPVLQYQNQRVVTLAMIDQVHQRPEGTAGRNFRANRHRFVEGKHFFTICSDEIRRNNLEGIPDKARRSDIVLVTEFGYLMLVKSFTDDLAWKVQEMLVDSYFRNHAMERTEEMQACLQNAHAYWFTKYPHWWHIRRHYLARKSYRDIAALVNRSVSACRHAVKRMQQVGVLSPQLVARVKLSLI
jgi:hypothetical protein